jgi:hypothetical protein
MAITGIGREYDLTLKAGASAKTSTSQYLCVGAGWTTTSTDWTGVITNDSIAAGTINAYAFLGVNQTGAMSASSESMGVRMHGISKVKCAASIQAFSFVEAYNGASTTTFRGHIQQITSGSSVSAATMSISSHTVVIGRALESGSTNSVISVFVNPQLYDRNLIA